VSKPVVFIICSGVGHINRGYESFATECNEAIRNNDQYDIILLKGAGSKQQNELPVWCIHRNSTSAKFISKITGKEPYWLEQFTFAMAMLPKVFKYKPAVVLYWDFSLGTFLWHLRRFLKFKYKLLFSNGAPNGPPFTRMDHIQQHLPVHNKAGLDGGTPPAMQTLIPCGIHMSVAERLKELGKKDAYRKKLQLPVDKKIILSVGAVNRSHKRIDYVVDEVAQLPEEYFLIVLGQFTDETSGILQEAEEKMKGRYIIKNVAREEVDDYYKAADVFVLMSLREGLPRVLPEALSYGLPCFAHNYPVATETLGRYGFYIDAKVRGALANAITTFYRENPDVISKDIIQYAYDTYSWDVLAPKYLNMIDKVAHE